jgi:integral membrane protein (TIGR01906 family)
VLKRREDRLGLVRALVIALFIAAIPVALITTNIRIAISEQAVYDYSVREYGAAEVTGIHEDELIRANSEILRYLTTSDPGPLAISVQTGSGVNEPLFSASETAHMVDVRNLVQTLFTAQLASVVLLLTFAVLMCVIWQPRALAMAALCGSIVTAVVLGVAGVVAASGFDSAWTEFHVFAFSNDLWQLDPSRDHLIQMFPEAFWFDITSLIVVATLLEALVISAASAAYLVLTRPESVVISALPAPVVAGAAGHSRSKVTQQRPRHYFR